MNAAHPALIRTPLPSPCQGGPHNHQIGALAVALKHVATDEFKLYAKQVGSMCSPLVFLRARPDEPASQADAASC